MGLASSSRVKEPRPKNPKAAKVARKQDWMKVVDSFALTVLDHSYLGLPVRHNTMEASSLYESANRHQANCLMPGTHKHLGGAYDPSDGCIYGVPANSKSVLCLHPVESVPNKYHYEMKTIPLPDSIADCNFKWLRGIFAHGYMLAIPSWANSVLCVDVDAFWGRRQASKHGIVQLLELPKEHRKVVEALPNQQMQWQWHGAGMNKDKTAIYCIPSNAKQVLKVDLISNTTSLIPVDGFKASDYPNFSIDGTNKWYGGIVGKDNCVYGIPYRTCAVLKIDCENDSATLVGPDYGCTQYNWHGGIQVNGKIYAHPSHADTVLVINTNPGAERVCSELPIKRADYDKDPRKQYKWLGGSVGADGNIYCPACDTSSVLKINVTTDECTTFGFAGADKNKWQGGVLARDACVYCIPANGRHVLRIATDPGIVGEQPIQLLGDLPAHKDKWQGGHVGLDGALYFIPENGYRVLKITPPIEPPVIVDGKLPENDVVLELL